MILVKFDCQRGLSWINRELRIVDLLPFDPVDDGPPDGIPMTGPLMGAFSWVHTASLKGIALP